MSNEETKPSFWKTLPGIITAIAALLGAIATLFTTLYTSGVIGNKKETGSAQVETTDKEKSGEKPIIKIDSANSKINPKSVDRTDPKETAYAILQTYKAKDLVALYEYFNEANQERIPDPSAIGTTHQVYTSLFTGWRWQGIKNWNKSIGEIRFRHYVGTAVDEYVAHVKFGEISPLEFLVVTLVFEKGKWSFEDVHSPSAANFYEGTTEFKITNEGY